MKKVLFFLFICLLITGCENERGIISSTISKKIGIVNNTISKERSLALEFSSSFGEIQEINFESLWLFEVDGKSISVKLTEKDFEWSFDGRTVSGRNSTSLGNLLTDPSVIHKSTLFKGYLKVDGKWIKIPN